MALIAKPFASKITDLPSTELFAFEDNLAELRESETWKALEGLVGAARESLLVELVNGATLSQADYARRAGYLSGAEIASEIMEMVTVAAARRRAEIEADRARVAEAAEEDGEL